MLLHEELGLSICPANAEAVFFCQIPAQKVFIFPGQETRSRLWSEYSLL